MKAERGNTLSCQPGHYLPRGLLAHSAHGTQAL